jgi:hypothetical protein
VKASGNGGSPWQAVKRLFRLVTVRSTSGAPPVYRPQLALVKPIGRSVPAFRPAKFALQPKVISGQAKFYPNLNASAAIPVDRDEIYSLQTFFDNYRLKRPKTHGQLVANAKYIFVRTVAGELLLHPTFRHPVLAGGKPVLYAGEMYFDNGRLDWWSNGSGNYRPDADHAAQADLPMGRFFTFEEVLKGRHKDRNRERNKTIVRRDSGVI